MGHAVQGRLVPPVTCKGRKCDPIIPFWRKSGSSIVPRWMELTWGLLLFGYLLFW